MKKLIAILCAALMLVGMMVPAMADYSPAEVTITAEGEGITVTDAAAEDDWNATVAALFVRLTDAEAPATVKDIVSALILPEGATLEGDILTIGDKTIDLSKVDFVSKFYDLKIADGDSAEVTLKIDALEGVENDKLGDYKVLLIAPATAQMALLDLEATDDGAYKANFPFEGIFSVVQQF